MRTVNQNSCPLFSSIPSSGFHKNSTARNACWCIISSWNSRCRRTVLAVFQATHADLRQWSRLFIFRRSRKVRLIRLRVTAQYPRNRHQVNLKISWANVVELCWSLAVSCQVVLWCTAARPRKGDSSTSINSHLSHNWKVEWELKYDGSHEGRNKCLVPSE